jgi:hypothetical protein
MYDIINTARGIKPTPANKYGIKAFLEGFMTGEVETIIKNIDFSMKMEDMPLTEEDKIRLRNCINGKEDIKKVLQETIKKHTQIKA